MEKRDLNKRLVSFVSKVPAVNYLLVVNSDGLPLTNIAQSKENVHDQKYVSSLLRILSAPASNLETAYDTSEHLITVSMFSKLIIIQINLGTHVLGFIIDKSMWPVTIENFNSQLSQVYSYLSRVKNHKGSILQAVYATEQKTDEELLNRANEKIDAAHVCFNSFQKGTFNQYEIQLTTQDPREVCSLIGNALQSFCMRTSIVSEDNEILYENKEDCRKMSLNAVNSLQSVQGDFSKLGGGDLLLNAHFFMDGEFFVSSPLGDLEGKRLELMNQLSNWNDGFNELMSYNYTAVVNTHSILGSSRSSDFIELVNYLLSDIGTLQTEIESHLNNRQVDKAISLMKRSVYLLHKDQQYSNAGDFLKWIAYTFFENGQNEQAIKYYKKAAEDYKNASDYSNLASNLTDLASIYESLEKYASSISTYKKAKGIFQDIENQAQAQAIQEKIDELEQGIFQKVSEFVESNDFESIRLSEVAAQLDLNPEHLPEIFQELIRSNVINGSIDLSTNTYLKAGSNQSLPRVSAPDGTSVRGSGNRGGSVQDIQTLRNKNNKLDAEISKLEDKFSRRNVTVMDFLKYQAKIQSRNFNKTLIKLGSEQVQLNSPDGTPIRCPLCQKEFQPGESPVIGPGYHGFHTKCLSKWIKTQDKCPACNQKLLPSIFQGQEQEQPQAVTEGPSNEESQEKIALLEDRVERLKETLGSDADLFDKLVAERENKARLMRELNKKDRNIRELRSQLEIYKRARR